jgi:hypothetical protein
MRVFVYFNLRTKLWSVRALEGPQKGRVIAHRERTAVNGATWKCSEASRLRVIRRQQRAVHAGIVGDWTDEKPTDAERASGGYHSVTYNPYRGPHLTRRDTYAPVHSAARVLFIGRDCAVQP